MRLYKAKVGHFDTHKTEESSVFNLYKQQLKEAEVLELQ